MEYNSKENYKFFLVISFLVFGGITAVFVLSALSPESETAQFWLKYAFASTLVLLVSEIAAIALKPIPAPSPNPRRRSWFYISAAVVLVLTVVMFVLPGLEPLPVDFGKLLLAVFVLAGISQIVGVMAILKPVPLPDPNPR